MNFSVICSTIVHLNAFFFYHLNVMPLIHARAMSSCTAVLLFIRLPPLPFSFAENMKFMSRGQQSTS